MFDNYSAYVLTISYYSVIYTNVVSLAERETAFFILWLPIPLHREGEAMT